MARKSNISPDSMLKTIGEFIKNIPMEVLEELKIQQKKQEELAQQQKKQEELAVKEPILAHALPAFVPPTDSKKEENKSSSKTKKIPTKLPSNFTKTEIKIIHSALQHFAYYIESKSGTKSAIPIFDLVEKVELMEK
jgi:hypothetical protein